MTWFKTIGMSSVLVVLTLAVVGGLPACGDASPESTGGMTSGTGGTTPMDSGAGGTGAGGTGAGGTGVGGAGGNPLGKDYYVDSSSPGPDHDGSAAAPWKTIAQMQSFSSFEGGDVVHFSGSFPEEKLTDPGNGQPGAPILFKGEGADPVLIGGISLTHAQHLEFANFEAKGPTASSSPSLVRVSGNGKVSFITFKNLFLHDAIQGVIIGNHANPPIIGADLTFVNTRIERMAHDGIVLDDHAGDRFSFIGGDIKGTGKAPPSWGTHGIYASGGHGHLIDGVAFSDNRHGWALSIRRGNIVVRNSHFENCLDLDPKNPEKGMINNNNEDEGTDTNSKTDSPSHGLTYQIFRNLFIGHGAGCTGIYQSNNNDQGIDDPHNTWAIYNNTFVDTLVNFAGKRTNPPALPGQLTDGSFADTYDIYMRNNAFSGGSVAMSGPRGTHVHVLSRNGFPQDVALKGFALGNTDVTADPGLSAAFAVTSPAYVNKGAATIIQSFIEMKMGTDYLGSAPDIGQAEHP